MKTIEIQIPEGKSAKWVDGLLTLVDEKPTNVMDRIKSYEDACEELNVKPIDEEELIKLGFTKDEIAYRKLKTVVKALNENWKPNWADDTELKFWPWFILEKIPVIITDVFPNYAVTYPHSMINFCFYFKTRELALYAGNQFIDLYSDYLLTND